MTTCQKTCNTSPGIFNVRDARSSIEAPYLLEVLAAGRDAVVQHGVGVRGKGGGKCVFELGLCRQCHQRVGSWGCVCHQSVKGPARRGSRTDMAAISPGGAEVIYTQIDWSKILGSPFTKCYWDHHSRNVTSPSLTHTRIPMYFAAGGCGKVVAHHIIPSPLTSALWLQHTVHFGSTESRRGISECTRFRTMRGHQLVANSQLRHTFDTQHHEHGLYYENAWMAARLLHRPQFNQTVSAAT